MVDFSCHNATEIKKDRMREILFRIHECEAYHDMKYNNQNPEFIESCKSEVLVEYGVSLESYQKSLQYYKNHPSEFELLYDSLIVYSENKPI